MNRLSSVVLLLLILLFAVVTVIGNRGLLHLQQISAEVEKLSAKNRLIESEISDLDNKIYALEEDEHSLEVSAREVLGLSKPGEIVYIFSDETSTKEVLNAEEEQIPSLRE